MPRRRLSLVVAAGALALVALTGCQVEPGSSAFVDNRTYSKADVDKVFDGFAHDGGKVDPVDVGKLRSEIARDQVFVDVAARYAKEKGYGDPTVDTSGAAQSLGVPESDPLARLLAQQDGYVQLLMAKVPAVTPTDAELHEIYDYVSGEGLPLSYQQTIDGLRALDQFGPAMAVRRALTEAINRYRVQINPLYDPTFVLMQASYHGQSFTAVPLTLASNPPSPAVRDVSDNG